LRPWLSDRREQFFLASKTDERTGEGAYAGLVRSLERLGVEQLDLIQLHNLVEEDEFEQAHAKGGAVEALARARDEGLVRFIGVTGHGLRIPSMHVRSLDRFPFDSVLFPYNYLLMRDASYRRDAEELIDRCVAEGVALQTIKSVARRRWPAPIEYSNHQSWYEPLEDVSAIDRAVRFVLGHEHLFLICSSDYRLLDATLEAAEASPRVPLDDELDDDISRFDMHTLFDGGELERI
ncbi:MAG: aldo/keto reductase, partial [Acidimicrobiales bacterium]